MENKYWKTFCEGPHNKYFRLSSLLKSLSHYVTLPSDGKISHNKSTNGHGCDPAKLYFQKLSSSDLAFELSSVNSGYSLFSFPPLHPFIFPPKKTLGLLALRNKVVGLPCWLSHQESTCNAGDLGLEKSPGEGYINPLQYSCL